MEINTEPPSSATLRHLRASDGVAGLHLLGNATALCVGVLLAHKAPHWTIYATGELILAFAFLHAFVLLHEAGHHTLFRRGWINDYAGHIAGFVALIPYASWRPIHTRHHRFTGWQDLDATTATLVPRPIQRWECWTINFAWRFGVPLFSTLYRLQNYWHLARVTRFLGSAAKPVQMGMNVAALLCAYGALAMWAGPLDLMRAIGPALYLSFLAQDIILLSQHTHMPTNLSGGYIVRPFAPMQQGHFTRSMRLPGWLSRLLMHFDAHELHHMYPGVPGYHLRRIAYTPANDVNWLSWIRAARRLSGTRFLFGTREQTGLRL